MMMECSVVVEGRRNVRCRFFEGMFYGGECAGPTFEVFEKGAGVDFQVEQCGCLTVCLRLRTIFMEAAGTSA